MVKLSSLSLLIPAYNDETTIEKVVAEAIAVGKRVAKKFEIVVVNDGSTDATASLARYYLARLHAKGRLIIHTVNQGYGRTIKELYYAWIYDWLFTIPGDYQIGARELETIINSRGFFLSSPRRRGSSPKKMDSRFHGNDNISIHPDMILGWRVKRNDPSNRLLSSWIYNTLLRWLFGITLHDINSVRLMRRSILKNITLTSHSAFVDAELVIRAMKLGYTIAEVPIVHRARSDDRPGGGNQWGTMWKTVREMINFKIQTNPDQ